MLKTYRRIRRYEKIFPVDEKVGENPGGYENGCSKQQSV